MNTAHHSKSDFASRGTRAGKDPQISAAEQSSALMGLLEALLECSLDPIYFKDRESRFVRYSRSLAEHFGLSDPDALLGKTDFDCYEEARARSAFEDEQWMIKTGKPIIGKLERGVRTDGKVTWFLTTKMPWRDAGGEIVGTFGISKEVTELKETEAKLEEMGGLLQTLLENSPDIIYFKDRESRFVHFSKSFERLFQVVDTQSIRGKTDFDFFMEEHARRAYEDEQDVIRTGNPLIGKLEKETHPDGRITWCLTTKMPWRDKEGRIVGTFGISKDVTTIKESEHRLEEARKQLLEASRMAGMAEVATSVIHNVGNVLNSVNVSATLIKERLRNSKVTLLSKAAALVESNADHLAEFFASDPKGTRLPRFLSELSGLLESERDEELREVDDLARNIEHIKEIVIMQQNYSKVSGLQETVRVEELAEDALRINDAAVSRHGISIVRRFGKSLPEISIDKHKALQILINLVKNAVCACEESGRPDKQIVLGIESREERVTLTIEDNGVGILAENLTRIFNSGFTTRKEGRGFGLHSGALAAKELGGSLAAGSEGIGKGAVFTLVLPLRTPQEG